MKKFIAMILSFALAFGALPASFSTTANANAIITVDAEEYAEILLEVIDEFEDLMTILGALFAIAAEIDNENDALEWCELFDAIHGDIGVIYDILHGLFEYAPGDFEEGHAMMLLAVAYVYDALDAFIAGLVAYIEGDDDAFIAAVAEFAVNIEAAGFLWTISVYGYEGFMANFIDEFENLMDAVFELIGLIEEIEDDEDFVIWCMIFVELQREVEHAALILLEMEAFVPEEYENAHALLFLAIVSVHEAKAAFEDAVNALLEGNVDAFFNGIEGFIDLLNVAAALWEEAVE